MRIILPGTAPFLPSGPVAFPEFAATLEQVIPITGDVVLGPTTFWTASSSNQLGGGYILSMFAEVYNTTLNLGCAMTDFIVSWTENGAGGSTTQGPLPLDVAQSQIHGGTLFEMDNGFPVQWTVNVSGWTSGAGTLRVKASLLRVV